MREIRDYLQQCVEEGAFPGASWQIGTRDDILETGTVGVLGQGMGTVQADSLYDLASVTKIIVTCALMRQFQDGLVRLEDTV